MPFGRVYCAPIFLYPFSIGQIYVRLGQIVYPLNSDGGIMDHAESALILEHNEIF